MSTANAVHGPTNPISDGDVQSFGSVVGLKPEAEARYRDLHADAWPSVLERLRKSHVHNYSIFLAELEGRKFLFSYFEYYGDDFEADMSSISQDPETQRWWRETDPCQVRLTGTPRDQQWLPIERIFFAK